MQVLCKGIPIDYSEQGKGPTLLFVHGWGDSKKTWQALIEILAKDYRCIALDLPNFGASGRSASIVSLESMSGAIAEFLLKLRIDTYTYVGHSMGGQIGLFAVGSGALRPEKLVIIAGAGIRGERTVRNMVLKVAAKAAKPLVSKKLKTKLYKRIGSDYDPNLSLEQKAVIKSVLSHDVQIEAAMISVPTLLLYGEQDTATPPRFGYILHRIIGGSQYDQIAEADHWLHQTHAAIVAERIRGFISA
ncbi:MAG: hypothetical protein QG629_57 [Patescibacteria group bacterium]|nr:alpha/beta hydrolase [Candidatus Saccharibacteria bacterium]MDQ5962975.1 hypothetical protein [Patescibacteria group bacterium]